MQNQQPHPWNSHLLTAPNVQVVYGHRGIGKSTFLAQLALPLRSVDTIHFADELSLYDWPNHRSREELIRTLTILTGFDGKVARGHAPKWSFKLFCREEDWLPIKKRMHWIDSTSLHSFPTRLLLGTNLHGYDEDDFHDARGRTLPGMLIPAMATDFSNACREWTTNPVNADLIPVLRDVVVGRMQSYQNVVNRLRRVGRKPSYIKYLETAGVLARAADARWRWGPVYHHIATWLQETC